MSALTFDMHAAIKTLREAGFEEAQAEAVVATVGGAMGENVATTADFQALEQRMTAHIAGRFEVLYRNLWAMAVGIVAVTVTLVKLIP